MPLLLIRHGNTTYDKKVDAHLNPPLTEDGVERLKRTKKFLVKREFNYTKIISSPLQRAMKGAELISDGHAKVFANTQALPWNLGDLQGLQNDAADAKIEHLKNYPDLRAPHGESYRTFHDRWQDLLRRALDYVEMEQDTLIIVTHSRNIDDAVATLEGKPVGVVESVSPEGSVTLLAKNGVSDEWECNQIWAGL